MADIKIKDIIFSYRHMYLESLKRLNKRLKKHVSIDSRLINDITLYISNDKYKEEQIRVKYLFKKGSLGETIYDSDLDTFLKDNVVISKNRFGIYESNSKGVSVKDDKLAKEMVYALKDEFYTNINGRFMDKDASVSFTGYDITISTRNFIVCYNCVGDIIYVYTPEEIKLKDILDTEINVEFDEYHQKQIRKIDKIVDSSTRETKEDHPGDYTIKEKEKAITLSRIKKDKLHRYI